MFAIFFRDDMFHYIFKSHYITMDTANTNNRHFDYIDLLKGFGIFLVVWGHTMTPRSAYIYSFHMPLFFFLSGFVHKDKPLREFVLSKINSLYIPYLVFSFISWVFYLVRLYCHGRFNEISIHLPKIYSLINGTANNGGNYPIWFLPCILMVSIFFFLINHYLKKPILKQGIILVLSLVGYLFSIYKVKLAFQLDIALTGLVFYGLGFIVKEYGFLQKLDRIRNYHVFLFVLLCELIHILTAYLNTRISAISHVNMAGNQMGNYFLFYVSALAAITAFMILGYKIRNIRIINFLGVNTLIILAVHKPLLQVMNHICNDYMNISTFLYRTVASVIAVILSLALGVFLTRKIPFFLGKRPLIPPSTPHSRGLSQ
jgi:fucose 4-O-acetylase-like acetyltransferase